MSETERVEGIGEPDTGEEALPVDAEQIRDEIDEARAATDRFREKATELIGDLREREAESSQAAAAAQAAQAANDQAKLLAIADTVQRIQLAGCQGRAE